MDINVESVSLSQEGLLNILWSFNGPNSQPCKRLTALYLPKDLPPPISPGEYSGAGLTAPIASWAQQIVESLPAEHRRPEL